jgi:alpha-1,2-mannosyltransferase
MRHVRWPILVLLLSSAVKVGIEEASVVAAGAAWEHWRVVDLDIYATSVRYVLDGRYLYGFTPTFTYPPFALLTLVPLGVLPMTVVIPVWHLLKVFLIHLGAWWFLGQRGLSGRRRVIWSIVAGWVGTLLLDPTGQDISHGQINIVLMAVVAADLLRPATARWRGVGVGIAAGIKLVPGLFIIFLLVTRQWRAAAVATGAFLGTVAIGFAVLPGASWNYWTSVLWDNTRVWEKPEVVLNQTIHGVVMRALGHDSAVVWLSLSLLAVVGGLWVAVALHRRGADLAALCAVGLTAALVTPQGWIHHWVWLAPATLILAVGAGRSAWAWVGLVVLFLVANARPYYLIAGDPWRYDALHLGLLHQLLAANLIIALGVLFLLAVRWIRRTPAVTA